MVLYFGLTFEHCLILLKINSNRIEVVTIQSKSRNQSSLFTFCSILQNDLNHQYGKIVFFFCKNWQKVKSLNLRIDL